MRSIIAAVVALAVAGPAWAQEPRRFDPGKVYRISADGAPARGPAHAPVTIVEFSDFYCRYCASSQRVLSQLDALYPGKLRLVFRHNLLDPDDGTLAAEAAMAADAQGRFWQMHDRLFGEPPRTRRAVEGLARELGLDLVRFRRDLDSRAHRGKVAADTRVAGELGITSTPMFFVNGRPVKGAQGVAAFRRVIEQELQRAAGLRARGVTAAELYRTAVAGGRERGELDDIDEYAGAGPVAEGTLHRVHVPPGRARGPADALVTIVVFIDFECPACRAAAPVLESMRERFGDDLRVVLRHFPLDMHRHAELAAQAFEAAAEQGKGWPMHDAMIARQGPLDRPTLDELAGSIGLDTARFRAALDRRRFRRAVADEVATAAAAGVRATPTLVINGELIAGMPRELLLVARIEAARTAAAERVASGTPRAKVLETILRDAGVVEPAPPRRRR